MYKLLIKYFFIIFCSINVYNKILDINKVKKTTYIIYGIFSCLLSVFTFILAQSVEYIEFPLWIFCTFFFLTIYTSVSIDVSLTAIIISYCCSYISFIISAIIVTFFSGLLGDTTNIIIILQLITGIVQNILIIIPFRLKRLKKGMPFLTNPIFTYIGIYISMLVLFAAMLLNNGNDNPIYVLAIIFVLVSMFFIFIWWKSQLTKTYLYQLKNKEIEKLTLELENKKNRINEMEKEISSLAKIIHKDNKLIPAMELAVKNFINNSNDTNGTNLIIELEKLSSERKGILNSLELSNKKLISTNILSIDTLMNYFLNKTFEIGIEFNFSIKGNLHNTISNIINESELNTLLADIIENAFISTKYNNANHILVMIDAESEVFSLTVFDSGKKFDINVLINLGQKKITTHGDDSGSGIGLMSTYEILSKYRATFIIEEFDTINSVYTKQVSIVFDNRKHYILKSKRTPEEIYLLSKRKDLIYTPL